MRWSSGLAWRIGGALGILWLIAVALLVPSAPSSTDNDADSLSVRLKRALGEMSELQRQNADIRAMLADFTKQLGNVSASKSYQGNTAPLQEKLKLAHKILNKADETLREEESTFTPSIHFEVTRRRIDRGTRELWWFISGQLSLLQQRMTGEARQRVDNILEDGAEHVRTIHHDVTRLSQLDGLGVWREKEAQSLSALVQARLHALQNPRDCTAAKKLICNLNKGCGFGCQIHHVVYCLVMAYGSRRTLILKSKGWRYNKAGWEDVFLPLSDSCTEASGGWPVHWPGTNSSHIVDLPIIDTLSYRPDYLPPAVPADLAHRISRLSSNPSAWWIGQLVKFIMRPQPKIRHMLDERSKMLGFQRPIVGVHVRRTDKVGTEAAFHSLSEYMKHVEEYFLQRALTEPDVVRRVYIASDDPSVISDARKEYPHYEVLGDSDVAKTAAVATRYTDSSLKGIISDIHFLSLTDYLVCTFSSQVCRIAYEIMQTIHPDPSSNFYSLDDIFYYGGQSAHNQRVRFGHTPRPGSGQMTLEPDDIIGIAGNHWDGYSKGMNKRTRQNALYPSYKADDMVETGQCPLYADVQL